MAGHEAEKLISSKPFVEALLNSLGELVFVLDKDHRFVFATGPPNAFLIPPEKFVGEKIDKVVPEYLVNLYYKAFQQCSQKRPVEYEYELTIKGEKRYFVGTLSCIYINGEFNGTVVVTKEITERKKAAQELLKLETKYYDLFRSIPVGICVVRMDTWEILEFNPRTAEIFGYSLDEFKNIKINELYVNPDELRKVTSKLMSEGEINIDLRMRRKDSTIIHVQMLAKHKEDDSGNHLMEIVFQDITKIKELEQALRENLNRMEVLFEDIVLALSKIMKFKDLYTDLHQRRVADLTNLLSKKLNLDEETARGIYIAALLHDIGKIAVPSDILSKPTKLTDIEFELIKRHPIVGYEILREVDFPWPVAEIVLQHHERLDGSGYPYGLKDDEIMLEARILAVADVVEAMDSHRPYRPALGLFAALDEISKNRGKLYDPDVVDACLEVCGKGIKTDRSESIFRF